MLICPSCYNESPDMANFCMHCGTKLKPKSNSESEIQKNSEESKATESMTEALRRLMPTSYVEKLLATKGHIEGERRVVTILFSDVKGSTSLAENLDPEEVLEIMNGAFDVLIEPISRYEGTLARLMGDAILAFFGAPIAHEDDPSRACRAALDILEGARNFSKKLELEKGIKGFSVRVGINTGLVVVAEVGADLRVEYTAMGDAVNVAARMESKAEPGSILITEATRKLLSDEFEIVPKGPIQVKGKKDPINTFNVLRLAKANNGIKKETFTIPLSGRKAELIQIANNFEYLKQNRGKIISVTGEQGIGKSRLLGEATKLLSSDFRWQEIRASSYTSKSSYYLARNIIKDLLNVHQNSSEEELRDALKKSIDINNIQEYLHIYPFLLHFLNIKPETSEQITAISENAESLKGQIHFAFKNFIRNEAIKHPLVLVLEDLHWSDLSSLEILVELFPLIEEVPLILLFVYRITESEDEIWNLHYKILPSYKDKHEIISLNPLDQNECKSFIENFPGIQKLPDDLQNEFIKRSEGNPFYLKEVLQSLIDKGLINSEDSQINSSVLKNDLLIPDKLQSIIMTRIDCLAPLEKLLLQTASVIGRVFQKNLLSEIMKQSMSDSEIDISLSELQLKDFILRHLPTNLDPAKSIFEKEYIFKDNFVQDAVYSTLLLSQRQQLHKQIGGILENIYSDHIDEYSEIFAHHFEKGKVLNKAIFYYKKAADKSKDIFANEEAIYFYERILELGKSLTDTSLDLAEIHESLGDVYLLIANYSSSIDHFIKSIDYCKNQLSISKIYNKCGEAYERWGKYDLALQSFNDALKLLEDTSSKLPTSRIYAGMAMVYYRLGNYTEANKLSMKALKIAEKADNKIDIENIYNILGLVHCKLGDLDKSLEYQKQCLTLRESSNNLSGLAASYNNLGYLYQLQSKIDEPIECYNKSVELCEKIGNYHGLARAYDNLSQLYDSQNKKDLAIDYNLKSVTILAKIAREGIKMNSEVLRQSGVW